MKTAFITGANKGIGFETAKQLLQKGFFVYLGSRDLQKGLLAIEKLKAENITNLEVIQIDVTDEQSVKNARLEIGLKTRALDVLINNAGINGGSAPYTAMGANSEEFLAAFSTNVVGVASVTKVFYDLLCKSPEPRIVNVSTSVGSLTLQSDPGWIGYNFAKYAVYASAKAALNMYTIHLAHELRDTPFKVNAVCPGYTKTDFTGFNGGAVEEAGQRILKYALLDKDGVSGKFISEETNPATGEIPW